MLDDPWTSRIRESAPPRFYEKTADSIDAAVWQPSISRFFSPRHHPLDHNDIRLFYSLPTVSDLPAVRTSRKPRTLAASA